MKMVIAIVRPERLQSVKDALKDAGIMGVTIVHVTGHGEQLGLVFTTRVGEFVVDEIEKIQLELVVDDDKVQLAIDTIRAAAQTGHPGDGRIFILPVEQSIRIREEPKAEPAPAPSERSLRQGPFAVRTNRLRAIRPGPSPPSICPSVGSFCAYLFESYSFYRVFIDFSELKIDEYR